MNAALRIDFVDGAPVRDRTRHGVDLNVPDRAAVLRLHADEVPLEGGGAHQFAVHPGAADDVNEALDLGDALRLPDRGFEDHLAVGGVKRQETPVRLTGEDPRGGPRHLREGLERERRGLALVAPAPLPRDQVEARDAGVGRLPDDAARADQRRNLDVGSQGGAPDELPFGVVDLDLAAVGADGDVVAVAPHPGGDVPPRLRAPDDLAGFAVEPHDLVAARRIDGVVGHDGREALRSAFAHVRAPHDPGVDPLREVGEIVRLVRIRGREDAAAGKRKHGKRREGTLDDLVLKHESVRLVFDQLRGALKAPPIRLILREAAGNPSPAARGFREGALPPQNGQAAGSDPSFNSMRRRSGSLASAEASASS